MAVRASGTPLRRKVSAALLQHQQHGHQRTNLPQINDLLERDVGVIVAAPLAAVSAAVTAVAEEKRVGVRVVVIVQEAFDAPEDLARLQQELLWMKTTHHKLSTHIKHSPEAAVRVGDFRSSA